MSASRPIRLPAKDFNNRSLPVTIIRNFKGLRLHGAARPAIQFRNTPSHRFSHPDASSGLIYLADDLETCLWECFGDAILAPGTAVSCSIWMSRKLSEIHTRTQLRICDLTETNTRSALKVDLSALKHTDLHIPQAWGLAIMNHPDAVDGFQFTSRFTNRRCTVLFENSKIGSILKSKQVGNLIDLDQGAVFLERNEIALV